MNYGVWNGSFKKTPRWQERLEGGVVFPASIVLENRSGRFLLQTLYYGVVEDFHQKVRPPLANGRDCHDRLSDRRGVIVVITVIIMIAAIVVEWNLSCGWIAFDGANRVGKKKERAYADHCRVESEGWCG